ncbi:neprilysin-1 isoform X2 [Rhipicephalus microplus]|uniref:neprilysin-1 isoform X2 n=1 Tax=Rhipicephalus microplus TaxID=6941 RepID=UPI003F6D125B
MSAPDVCTTPACVRRGSGVGRDNEDGWNRVLQKIGVEEWPNGAGDVTIPLWSKLLGDLMTTFNHKPIVYVDVKWNRAMKKNVIHICPGSLPTKKEHLPSYFYKTYILEVAYKLSSTTLEERRVVRAVDEIIQFEQNLAEILAMKSNGSEESYVSVTQLENDVDLRQSMVDIFLIMDNIFKSAHLELRRNASVLVKEPTKVRLLLKACGEWEKHIVTNVLVWHALQTVGKDVLPSVQSMGASFKSHLWKVKRTSPPQTIVCNTALANAAPSPYSMIYILNFFNESSMNMAKVMIDFQQSLFFEELKNSKWMDQLSRMQALQKLTKLSSVVGYPKWITDEKMVASYTPTGKRFNDDPFVYYYVACAQLHMKNKLRTLLGRARPGEGQPFNAAMVNAYYSRTDNKIVIPAGIIQDPFFDPGLPRYINYATLGYIILHEITHGFDSEGRKYNDDGAFINWWPPMTAAKFRKKAQCFLEQYGNVTDPVTHMKLPSKQTLAEDISDNAAARLSYLAFLKQKQIYKDDMQLLPGLESYTPAQLHFISAAQLWCKKYDKNTKRFVIDDDVHSVSEQRVNIPFGNTPQFAEVFNCPRGSKMNFAKKCRIW